jgi:hypothetical protein
LAPRAEPLRLAAPAARPRDRAGRRALARRQAVRRRRAVAGMVLVLAALAVWALRGSGSPAASRSTHRPAAAHGGTHPQTLRASTPSPGSLPQTHTYPSAATAQFKALMADLWSGVVHDSLNAALPAFFPEGAYVQLKAIADSSSDWTGRLVRDYGLDIGAAHALLGSGAAHARLLAVNVVSSYGHWIGPGVCYNGIGYYEMPNARVVYSEAGQTRSFGIASMISWRGVWYVVHFGSILRPSVAGFVDDPAVGPGSSAYSGTC